MARAPVSKTGGWGFESLHSCQFRTTGDRRRTTELGMSSRSPFSVLRPPSSVLRPPSSVV